MIRFLEIDWGKEDGNIKLESVVILNRERGEGFLGESLFWRM